MHYPLMAAEINDGLWPVTAMETTRAKLASVLRSLVKLAGLPDTDRDHAPQLTEAYGLRLQVYQDFGAVQQLHESAKFESDAVRRERLIVIDHTVQLFFLHLLAIVQSRAKVIQGSYMFPGYKENSHIVGDGKMWDRVVLAAGLVDVTPHDLRRTFMSVCTELGYPMTIGDALLGHSLGKIRDTYVHLGSEGIMATASQETADWIAAAMAGKKVKPGVKVAKEEKAQAGTA